MDKRKINNRSFRRSGLASGSTVCRGFATAQYEHCCGILPANGTTNAEVLPCLCIASRRLLTQADAYLAFFG